MEINYTFLDISSISDKLIEDFSCGNSIIDTAIKNNKRNADGTAIGVIDNDKNKAVAFCIFSTAGLTKSVENDRVTSPAAEIKYFAVDKRYQHITLDDSDEEYKISDHILCQMIDRLSKISEEIIYFEYVILYSVPDYVNFYKRNAFEEFDEYMVPDSYRYIDECVPMFLPV